ncbi:MAG: peroxidase family protein [Persephonella sp.]|nr:peroxidase family protein [Persephonella sp.]
MMLTSDLALRYDPVYSKISKQFLENPEKFEEAFAKAWFKLLHRDMGPPECYLGPEVPDEVFPWQDPVPERDFELIDEEDVENLKKMILSSGLSIKRLVYTAWSSASTYRNSDRKGGANGARIRFSPIKDWEVNHPDEIDRILDVYRSIQKQFNSSAKGGKKVSMADLIVLGGCAAIEKAAEKNGYSVKVPFTPGRVDVPEEYIDVPFYKATEPFADGFRNYFSPEKDIDTYWPAEYWLVDRAQLLTLTVPEMTALVGGLRVLGATYRYDSHGVFTKRPETLSNDFFVNLLDMNIEWEPVDDSLYLFNGYDRKTGNLKWTGTRADLIFGHHGELRAVAEVYASSDGEEKFINDFIKAWDKVMNLDRFDLK